MRFLPIIASIMAGAATVYSAALAQGGPIQPCTYTAYTSTACVPADGIIRTITAYEVPFTATTTQTFDCQGCASATFAPANTCPSVTASIDVEPTDVVPIPESVVTVAACSPTPN